MRKRPRFPNERVKLDAYTKKTIGCWNWTGPEYGRGYGMFAFRTKKQPAHRVAYRLFTGPIKDGLDIHHVCKNKRCVNPGHLMAVTRSEHLRLEPSSTRWERCKWGHALKGNNLYIWIQSDGYVRHICRTCNRLRQHGPIKE